jgi:hypothetical protein
MELTFGEGAEEMMVEAFGLGIDNEDYVVDKDGERLTDGYGTPIKRESIGGIIPLDHHGFSVNEEGIVINHEKEPVAFTTEKGTGDKRDSIVPFITDDGEDAGIVRDNFSCVADFVEESVSKDNTDQNTL